MTEAVLIDQVELGLDRMLSQWDDKPIIRGLFQSYLQGVQDVEDMWFQLMNERDLVSAIGAQLDILGSIVGEDRLGRDDEDYRDAIYNRIAINTSDGTPPKVTEILKLISGGSEAKIMEYFPASVFYYSNGFLTNAADTTMSDSTAAGVKSRVMFSQGGETFIPSGIQRTLDNLVDNVGDQIIDNVGDSMVVASVSTIPFGTNSFLPYTHSVGTYIPEVGTAGEWWRLESTPNSDEPFTHSNMGVLAPRVVLQSGGTLHYGVFNDETTIYKNGLVYLEDLSANTVGTIVDHVAGDVYESSEPFTLVSDIGISMASYATAGKAFGIQSRRGLPSDALFYVYAPYEDATVTFTDSNGNPVTITEFGASSGVVSQGVVTTLTYDRTIVLNSVVRFTVTSDQPIVIQSRNGDGDDNMTAWPASREVLLIDEGNVSRWLVDSESSDDIVETDDFYFSSDSLIAVTAFADGA